MPRQLSPTPRMLSKWRQQLSATVTGRDRTRELVRIRDGRKCRMCGKQWVEGQRRLDVHHLNGLCGMKSRSYDKIKDMPGLISLCHACHYHHHEYMGDKWPRPHRAQ